MDGTLADSSEYHWLSWQEVLADEGVRITRDDFLSTFGRRNAEILKIWIGPHVEPERAARIGDAKEVAYRALLREGGVDPLPGAAEWVRALRTQGWRQAVASSAPRANIEVMLEVLGLTELVDAYLGAEDVSRGKPEPDVFLNAAARLAVPAMRCVVVEDAAAGIEAGRRGGMATIGVGHGKVDAADVVVRSLTELAPDVFARLLGGR
jgi:beta-phosphoglucomutase